MKFLYGCAKDPVTMEEALSKTETPEWRIAIEKELFMIEKTGVWKQILFPVGKKMVKTKWVFSQKLDPAGNAICHRAWLAAERYSEREGID